MDYSSNQYELSRRIRILKMRGSDHDTHPYRLDIEPGGLSVEKISARDFARSIERPMV
jgi:KaiC/GvpD/RAD55 family RecA-like ATPase